jgi:hypothetical protein
MMPKICIEAAASNAYALAFRFAGTEVAMRWLIILAAFICLGAGPATNPAQIPQSPLAAATADFVKARAICIERLQRTPEYIQAQSAIDAYRAARQSARESNDPDAIMKADIDFAKSRHVISELEDVALSNDANVVRTYEVMQKQRGIIGEMGSPEQRRAEADTVISNLEKIDGAIRTGQQNAAERGEQSKRFVDLDQRIEVCKQWMNTVSGHGLLAAEEGAQNALNSAILDRQAAVDRLVMADPTVKKLVAQKAQFVSRLIELDTTDILAGLRDPSLYSVSGTWSLVDGGVKADTAWEKPSGITFPADIPDPVILRVRITNGRIHRGMQLAIPVYGGGAVVRFTDPKNLGTGATIFVYIDSGNQVSPIVVDAVDPPIVMMNQYPTTLKHGTPHHFGIELSRFESATFQIQAITYTTIGELNLIRSHEKAVGVPNWRGNESPDTPQPQADHAPEAEYHPIIPAGQIGSRSVGGPVQRTR